MDDRNFVTRLLKQSILTMCREAVNYSSQLEVDGIVSVTIDKGAVHIVKIHDLFLKQESVINNNKQESLINNNKNIVTDHSPINREIKQVTQVADIHYDERPVTGGEESVVETGDDSNDSKKEENGAVDKTPEYVNAISTDKDKNRGYTDTGSPSPQPESLEVQLQKLPISKETNILCKKCHEVQPDVFAFENHTLKVHSQYTCQVCLSTFTSRNNMKRHIRIHTGVKPYSCKQCNESFARNDDYKRHLLRHTFNKPFRCSICYAGYSDRSCIKTHMMKEHDGREQHICPQCGETYVNVVLFQQHKKIHPELNDYSCAICSFTGPSGLLYNKHMLTHGPPRDYSCTHCEVSFRDPFKYTSHLKLHKNDDLVQNYGCCFCDLQLSTFEQFQRHEYSHVQPRQYACKICSKQFRYPSNLKEHLMTHIMKASDKAVASQLVKSLNAREPELDELGVAAGMNEQRDQENTEMNNNIVGLHKGIEEEERKNSDDGHSNDYWCAECNQGFETEKMLQDHIINTHEVGTINESLNSAKTSKRKADIKVRYEYKSPSPPSQSSSPYEMLTQVDNYDYMYEQSTQVDPIDDAIKNRAFDEETIVDGEIGTDEKNETIDLSMRNKTNGNLTPAEMAITQNAMRQVLAIQHKFGIVPQTRPRKNPYTRHIPSMSAGHSSMTSAAGLFSNGFRSSSESSHKPFLSSSNVFQMKKSQYKGMQLPLSYNQTGLKASTHSVKNSTYAQDMDDNAMDIDIHESSSNEGNNSSVVISDGSGNLSEESRSLMSSPFTKPYTHNIDNDKSHPSTPTSLNLKVRNPGFEKVVTPDILFKTKAPFTCEVCEETYQDFESFDRHGTMVHRRYICSYCGKVFTSRPNRERHVRYHTGEKPYKCDICSVAFHRGDDLKYHRTTRHPDIKPFVCGVCTSTYAQAKDLEKHLQMYPDHRN